jgi:hypothetical protein
MLVTAGEVLGGLHCDVYRDGCVRVVRFAAHFAAVGDGTFRTDIWQLASVACQPCPAVASAMSGASGSAPAYGASTEALLGFLSQLGRQLGRS